MDGETAHDRIFIPLAGPVPQTAAHLGAPICPSLARIDAIHRAGSGIMRRASDAPDRRCAHLPQDGQPARGSTLAELTKMESIYLILALNWRTRQPSLRGAETRPKRAVLHGRFFPAVKLSGRNRGTAAPNQPFGMTAKFLV